MIKNYSTKSWHYRLASIYGNLGRYKDTDICTYIRACMLGVVWMFAIIVLLSMVLVFALNPVLFVIASFQYGWIFELSELQTIAIVTWFLGISFFVMCCIVDLIKRIPKNIVKIPLPKIPTDTFVTHAYQSIKNKMCFRLVLTENVSEFNVIPHKIGVKLSRRNHMDLFTYMLPVGKEIDHDIKFNAVIVYDFTTNEVIHRAMTLDSDEVLIEELRNAPEKNSLEVLEVARDYFYW